MPAITAIYNEGIAGREATFETRPREPAEVAAWLEDGLPLLVAEGAAARSSASLASSAYSDRCVYSGRGGARRLRRGGRARPRASGARCSTRSATRPSAPATTSSPRASSRRNAASRAVHRAAGFEEVGVQRRHGRLDGEWRDCVLVERLLGEAARATIGPY